MLKLYKALSGEGRGVIWEMTFKKEDRTKTRNKLGNGSKNRSIKFKICSPSGRGRSFHGRGLTSALVTRMSMQVSPPVLPCAAS